jgi:hypothetical protein
MSANTITLPRDVLQRAEHALYNAGVLCDAVPTRLQNSDDAQLANIGSLVNEQGIYGQVRDAHAELKAALEAPAAASGAGTQHDERAAFEAWCNEDDDLGTSRGYGAGTGEYDEHDTNYAWKAWQARAALAAAPAAAKSVSESRDIQNHMMVIACQAAQGEHASGKAMLRAVTKALAGDQNLMRKIIAKHAPAAAHPLSVLQYNAIPALQAIPPSLFESVVRGVERAFCAKNGITLAGAAGATGEQRGDE